MPEAIFIIGCPRSATTASVRVLQTATNAVFHVEQSPRLRIVSRRYLNGQLADPICVLRSARHDKIREAAAQGLIYGDKNPCFLPFIPDLVQLWDAKILFLVRDGRDVVRSLLDFYAHRSDAVFNTWEDEDHATVRSPEESPWDYSRLRPQPPDPLAAAWKRLARFEKCAWYWANFNRTALAKLSQIPAERWIQADATSGAGEYQKVFDFLGLEGFDTDRVEAILAQRVNKTGAASEARFPRWRDWSQEQSDRFAVHAGPMMARLGYGTGHAAHAA